MKINCLPAIQNGTLNWIHTALATREKKNTQREIEKEPYFNARTVWSCNWVLCYRVAPNNNKCFSIVLRLFRAFCLLSHVHLECDVMIQQGIGIVNEFEMDFGWGSASTTPTSGNERILYANAHSDCSHLHLPFFLWHQKNIQINTICFG